LGFCTFKVASIFLKEAALIKPLWNKKWAVDNRKSIEELNIEYIDYKDSLKEMIETMIKFGYLPDKITKK